MTSAFISSINGVSIAKFPTASSAPIHPGAVFGQLRLPGDPIGATSVTFDGIVAGSEIRVYLPDATEVAGIESCAENQVLSWPVYAAGNSSNVVRIVIINLGYRLKDFAYTSKVGNVSIPIQMDTDPWYLNP